MTAEGFRSHRAFAWFFDRFAPAAEEAGLAEYRSELVGDIEGRVLEVGAGTGLNLDKYRKADEVVALEPDVHMLKRLRSAAARATVAVKVEEGVAYPLPFESESFDAVVFCLVLCTIPDPARALTEAKRVLRPGGSIRFFEHVRGSDPKMARRQDFIQPVWSLFGGGCHPNRDTLKTIQDSGFEYVESEAFDFPMGVLGWIAKPHIRGRAVKP